MARPSEYERRVKPHIDEIRKAVEAGATVEEIAKAFDIAPSTIYKYKTKYKEFSDAFARGREKVIIEIKAALLKKALGYEYKETKTYTKISKDGEQCDYIETTMRHQPPSETAAAMLMRNYTDDWLDRDVITTELKKQEMRLKRAIAESTNFDLNMGDENNAE